MALSHDSRLSSEPKLATVKGYRLRNSERSGAARPLDDFIPPAVIKRKLNANASAPQKQEPVAPAHYKSKTGRALGKFKRV
jgi:hypothetical protein